MAFFQCGIQMEHTSDIAAEGKLIGESSYVDWAKKYTELASEKNRLLDIDNFLYIKGRIIFGKSIKTGFFYRPSERLLIAPYRN